MKRVKYIILLILLIFISGCSTEKKAIDYSKFNEIMTKEDYMIINVKDQFSDYDYIEGAYIAIDPNSNFQIEFYELSNAEYGLDFYNINKEVFQATESSSSTYTNVDTTNYNKYTLVNNESYKVISRIDNTIIYVDTFKKYSSNIKSILKKLGY